MFMPLVSRSTAARLRDTLTEEEQERTEEAAAQLCRHFGKSHALAVFRTLAFADRPLRFGELQDRLDVSPNTLSERLNELTDLRLVRREAYSERPPRVEYSPTERGEALFPALAVFDWWAAEYELADRETTADG
jgi:DNA-binding HxlR family transcriptional regulator